MFGAPKTRFSYVKYCKNLLLTAIVSYGFRARNLSFLKALGAFVLVFAALERRLKINGILVM